jgi:septum formation inhibitor MinC
MSEKTPSALYENLKNEYSKYVKVLANSFNKNNAKANQGNAKYAQFKKTVLYYSEFLKHSKVPDAYNNMEKLKKAEKTLMGIRGICRRQVAKVKQQKEALAKQKEEEKRLRPEPAPTPPPPPPPAPAPPRRKRISEMVGEDERNSTVGLFAWSIITN